MARVRVTLQMIRSQSVSQSVSQSSVCWLQTHIGTHDQILICCQTIMVFIVMGRPLWREDRSVCYYLSCLCQVSLSVSSHFTNNAQSVGPSVLVSSPVWDSWPYFYSLVSTGLFIMGRPPRCVSVTCALSGATVQKIKLFIMHTIFNMHIIYNMFKTTCQSRLWMCPILIYNRQLSHLNGRKPDRHQVFKYFVLSVHDFALSCVANSCIRVICDFCFLPA